MWLFCRFCSNSAMLPIFNNYKKLTLRSWNVICCCRTWQKMHSKKLAIGDGHSRSLKMKRFDIPCTVSEIGLLPLLQCTVYVTACDIENSVLSFRYWAYGWNDRPRTLSDSCANTIVKLTRVTFPEVRELQWFQTTETAEPHVTVKTIDCAHQTGTMEVNIEIGVHGDWCHSIGLMWFVTML